MSLFVLRSSLYVEVSCLLVSQKISIQKVELSYRIAWTRVCVGMCMCMQLEATGKESSEIQEAQALQISEMEERLRAAGEDKERLKAEGRKMKAHSKV